MTTPGQNAKFTFDGAAGQRVSLKVSSSTLSQAYVSIAKPDGSSFVKNTIFATLGTFIDTQTLPVAGTYTVTIDPLSTATGSATLTLYEVPADATASMTIGGAPQPVSVATPGQNARVTFDGTAGWAVSLKLSSITISSSYVSILKPDGTILVANTLVGTTARTITATLPVDGTYTVVIDPLSAAVGGMTLTLT